MNGFGKYNSFPFRPGGGTSIHEIEHAALLRAMERVLDPDEDLSQFAETYGEAHALAIMWACNERAGNQGKPLKMIDVLEDWEEACSLYPTPADSDRTRRERVAAKLRGIAGNSPGYIESTCVDILGDNFGQIFLVPPELQTTYWPGINPGPHGQNWASNRSFFCVKVLENGVGEALLLKKIQDLATALDAMLPVWMRYAIGTTSAFGLGDLFIVAVGIAGKTLI